MTSPPTFTIEWHSGAAKELFELPRALAQRIAARVERLAEDPYAHGARRVIGYSNIFRVRVGDYRIVYLIRNEQLLVLVLHAAHRSRVYDQLKRSRRGLDS